jgi:16S rRNA (cytosine1402-N4)-methyltransferase
MPEIIQQSSRHVPVMLPEVLAALQPETGGIFIDGTFGAGGYTRGILQTASAQVIAIDRDPSAIANGQVLVSESAGRLRLVEGTFGTLGDIAADLGVEKVQGVVLDIGVSSMQIDEAERGFSFMRDGPLDMRMGQDGPSAFDYVKDLTAEELAQIIYILGEEQRSRAIAKAIIKARAEAPILTTLDLVKAIEQATGPQRAQDRTHPATRTFQALRIHVNSELDELGLALSAAEEILEEGGRLVVVTFHSLEDRIVKRFFAARGGNVPLASRHAPVEISQAKGSFHLPQKGHVEASTLERLDNPRSRSAKLRFGIRTSAPAFKIDFRAIAVPQLGRH